VCQACGTKIQLRDRYHIIKILGKGGFGATFLAADLMLPGRPLCVVKQLRPSNDSPSILQMSRELFQREAQTLGRVGNHPQVPRLLDYFEINQQFYLIQEYVRGHNLQQEVKLNGPFSEAGVKQFLSEILPIIQYIHSQHVIHRDLKPANLIRREEDRKMVLIDFGAVKNQVNTVLAANSSEQTALTAFAVGTMGFAPPEQMAMRPVYASDIYAIGVTCLYLLTGKSPKDLGTDPLTGEIAWEKHTQVSEPFTKVIKKMLELAVSLRYKTAEEVLQAMDMVPYSESLAQSLIAKPSSKDSSGHLSPSTQLKSTPLSSQFLSEPTSQISSSVNSKLAMGIRNRRRNHQPSTSPPATPAVNQADYQIVHKGASRRNQGNSQDTADKNKLVSSLKLNASTIMESYSKGNRDFAQQDLSNLSLMKAHLPSGIFYQSKLIKINLYGANLIRADFGRANLSKAILRYANLSHAYLSYTNLEEADLRGANLSGAYLKHANLRGANLCGTNLTNAQVTREQLAHAKTNWMTVMPSGKRGFW
jgi:serine/threonine-protein kinase